MQTCLIVVICTTSLVLAVDANLDLTEKILSSRRGDHLPAPDSVDWRLVPGRVFKVKNQQLCLSSWAFAATGILEGQQLSANATSDRELIELSEQNLLDCDTGLGGCGGGGSIAGALEFISKQGGIDDRQTYPYEGKIGFECLYQADKSVMSTKGPILLPEGDEQKLKEVVASYGPVGVTIEATKKGFFQYRGGVLKDDTCRNTTAHLWHSMLVVGFGTDDKEGDYWIVKNQWSNVWGENGYLRMARNRDNMCGIATRAVIAAL